MKLKIVLTALLLLSVTACTTNGQGRTDYCVNTKFIYMSPEDKLTPRTEAQIVKHDETREKICGHDG